MATSTAGKPTSRQLAYLKNLANRTGQTFTYPQTSRQASAEINRLKHAQPSSRTERYVERKLIADQIATGPLDAARVREDEISGRGSSATWMHNREQEPPPMEDPGPAAARRRRAPVVGQADRARPLHRHRRRTDPLRPADRRDRSRHRPPRRPRVAAPTWSSASSKPRSELDALIADYLQQATKLDSPPLAVCPLENNPEANA